MGEIISTAFLMGGLGNQMFQISHAICQGWKYNKPSKFIPVASTPMQANQPVKYIKNIYRNVTFIDNIENLTRMNSSWAFSEVIPTWETSVEFYGYFQSNKNFFGFDERIKELFSPTEEFLSKVEFIYPQIKNNNTISIHVRRGDYLSISHILPVIDKSYIDEAIRKNGEYDYIFIFSDDKEWVENNLKYENQIIVTGLEDYEELWMISLCKNNIMSNSSFSWWGSFLNKNEEKKVYVPTLWFGPSGEPNYKDIYLNNWIKIDVIYNNGNLIFIDK